MKMVIRAPLLDRNEVEPPASKAARRLSPPELEALKAAVDKQIKLSEAPRCEHRSPAEREHPTTVETHTIYRQSIGYLLLA